MRYFTNCKTAEELRKEYHKQCKALHPDNGGSAEAFKEMKAEFEKAWQTVGNVFTNAKGETYEKKTTMSAEAFETIIEKMIYWTDCNIEIIGSWLWVSGNTYSRRAELKKLGFGFSNKKKVWYFHEGEYHKKNGKVLSMDQLRDMFGCEKVDTKHQETLGQPAMV